MLRGLYSPNLCAVACSSIQRMFELLHIYCQYPNGAVEVLRWATARIPLIIDASPRLHSYKEDLTYRTTADLVPVCSVQFIHQSLHNFLGIGNYLPKF